MRGTLHFIAPEDLHWVLAITTPRLVAGAARRLADLELDEKSLEGAREIVVARLTGGKALSRTKLLAHIHERGVSTEGQRGYHVLWHLSQTGSLCFGPVEGKEQTFVLLDEWVKKPRRFDERDEALGELARRYFVSHGPATTKDFAGWTKLTAGDVATGLAVARPHLAELTLSGTPHFMAADAEAIMKRGAKLAKGSVVVLPGFDEYLLGYKDRSAVLPAKYAERIVPGGNGVFKPTIVEDGQVVGTWSRVTKAKETVITPDRFSAPSTKGTGAAAATKAFETAVRHYGQFIGQPVRVKLPLDD
jgi:hypothetical protein